MKLIKNIPSLNLTLIVPLIIVAFVGGWQLGHRDVSIQRQGFIPKFNVTNQEPPAETNIDFSLFWKTWDLVSKKYVDKKAIDPQKMYYGAIQGMVAALDDPYTVFLPPSEQKSTQEQLRGDFEGVGMELGFNKDKRLVVIAPLDDSPASKAGVRAGDYIVKIEDKDTGGLGIQDAVNLIRGTKGTKVTLEMFREGDTKTKTVTLERDTIVVKSVSYQTKQTPSGKTVGYIKLARFGERTKQEWDQAVLDAQAAQPSSVIVDVRNDPGGYLEMAVHVASEFLDRGQDVMLQEDSDGNRRPYKVNRVGNLQKIPLIVLINKGSASASEIFAGAMRDYGRAKLVGEKSFGKGTIQEPMELDNGTGIHITTAKWLTPKGNWVHHNGLDPDETVVLDEDQTQDEQLNKALEMLN